MPGRFFLYLFNLYFYTLFMVVSAVVTTAMTLCVACLGLVSSRRRTMKRFRRAINLYGRAIIAAPFPFIRFRYIVEENSDPGEPYIFVCNHRSACDAYLMGILPHELVQVVNVWPFRIPVLGIYAKLAGYLNIRMLPTEEFMARAERLLKDGVSVVFFPEGTRSTDYSMGQFHGSAFRLALASRAPIVPLCISGSEHTPPKGSPLLRPGTVTVRRLPAITWDQYKDMTPFALKNRVWNIIDQELARMENRG